MLAVRRSLVDLVVLTFSLSSAPDCPRPSARCSANFKRRMHAEQHTSLNSSVLSNADQMDGVPNAPMPVSRGSGARHHGTQWDGPAGTATGRLTVHASRASLLSARSLHPKADMATGFCSSKLQQIRNWLSSKTRWDWLGLIFFIIGNVANFVSLGFAPQSMLAACGSVQFATNVFCELYFKGQAITGRVLKATCVILAGNTLIVAFASHESQQLNVDELLSVQHNKLPCAQRLAQTGCIACMRARSSSLTRTLSLRFCPPPATAQSVILRAGLRRLLRDPLRRDRGALRVLRRDQEARAGVPARIRPGHAGPDRGGRPQRLHRGRARTATLSLPARARRGRVGLDIAACPSRLALGYAWRRRIA